MYGFARARPPAVVGVHPCSMSWQSDVVLAVTSHVLPDVGPSATSCADHHPAGSPYGGAVPARRTGARRPAPREGGVARRTGVPRRPAAPAHGETGFPLASPRLEYPPWAPRGFLPTHAVMGRRTGRRGFRRRAGHAAPRDPLPVGCVGRRWRGSPYGGRRGGPPSPARRTGARRNRLPARLAGARRGPSRKGPVRRAPVAAGPSAVGCRAWCRGETGSGQGFRLAGGVGVRGCGCRCGGRFGLAVWPSASAAR